MTRLILLRHGQSEANELNIFSGQSDVPLTKRGINEAELAAKYLLERESIDVIYSSDLSRAYNTALPVAEALGLAVTKDKTVREFDVGFWVGKSHAEIEKEFPESYYADPSLRQYPGGEYIPDAFERSVSNILRIANTHPGKTVLIAAHGGVIRCFDAFSKGYGKNQFGNSPITRNASISIYEVDGEKVTPIKTDITEHLDGSKNIPTDKYVI
jgi:broad specificity phosphatase PhoE